MEPKTFKNNILIALSFSLILLVAAGCVYAYKIKTARTIENPAQENLIGGQKDDRGCLIGAGYGWCEAKQKCLRPWEEPCE